MRLLAFLALAAALLMAADDPDLSMVHRIKTEAFENSKVMEHLYYLTDVHGPRLTNSPGFQRAGEWTVRRMKELGAADARLEKWGPFGRGWSYSKFSAHLAEPGYAPLIGFPLAWSPGTNGVLRGEPFYAPMKEEKDLAKYKGKLKGKIELVDEKRVPPMRTTALGRRYTAAELDEVARMDPPARPAASTTAARNRWAGARNRFLAEEGAAMMVSTGYEGDGGTVFATRAGSHDGSYADPPPSIVLVPEHYNRVVRLLDHKTPARLEVEVDARFHTETKDSFNVVAEIPGGSRSEELVILGAHFDSWHGGTGASDNAAGCAVMMEAMRVLAALGVKMDRTVRMVLWSGEEQGLLGSKAYVKEHFADPEKMQVTAKHGKVAGYFNYDNGGGKIRGIYLQGNDMARPLFEKWMKPFADLGMTHISGRNTGGTDHLSFDAVGIPGFQFIQDPLEYMTRTHHSNMDVYDHLVEADLKQAAAVVASFVYHAAMRPEMLPRKPLPKAKPRSERKGGRKGE